jgi:hypothetical protein
MDNIQEAGLWTCRVWESKIIFCPFQIIGLFPVSCWWPISNLPSEFMTQIFVPVHRNAHWCLALINMKDKTLQYLESLVGWGRDVLDILVGLSDQTESYTILRLECLNCMGLPLQIIHVILVYVFLKGIYNWYSLSRKQNYKVRCSS